VQGSDIGPSLNIVFKGDLQALSQLIDMFKYADDTMTLLVPEHTDINIDQCKKKLLSL